MPHLRHVKTNTAINVGYAKCFNTYLKITLMALIANKYEILNIYDNCEPIASKLSKLQKLYIENISYSEYFVEQILF